MFSNSAACEGFIRSSATTAAPGASCSCSANAREMVTSSKHSFTTPTPKTGPMSQDPSQDIRQWVSAASARAQVHEAVGRVYAELEAEIAKRRPLCVLSGRCCQFDEYGHRLYVTTLELATFIQGL